MMMKHKQDLTLYLLTLLGLLTMGAAQAHVTLDQPEAPAGSAYRAVFKVGHGCGDGAGTRQIAVTLPSGLKGAKPMPKAGWSLEIAGDGSTITWTARSEADVIQDAWYDEFTVRIGALPAEPGALWFKVRQGCTSGKVSDWAEQPADGGAATKGLKMPAARLLVVAPVTGSAPGEHHH